MALHATIHKADLELSDIDRGLYGDYPTTIARHPSETEERLIVRLLAYALNIPEDGDHGPLEFAKDLWNPDEPSLWQKDYTGEILQWIEVGQPDEKRITRMTSRVARVKIYSYASSTDIWWSQLGPRLSRVQKLSVWQIPNEQTQKLATLVNRTMHLNVTIQDGGIWMGDDAHSIEVTPMRLFES